MEKTILTANTRKGMTSMMISVDFTPMALKNPTDPRTDSMTSITPERPRSTWNSANHMKGGKLNSVNI